MDSSLYGVIKIPFYSFLTSFILSTISIAPDLCIIPISPTLYQPSASIDYFVSSGFLKYPSITAFPFTKISPDGLSESVKQFNSGTSRNCILLHPRFPPACPPVLSQKAEQLRFPAVSVHP